MPLQMSEPTSPNVGERAPASRSPTLAFLCPLYVELKAVRATFDDDLGSDDVDGVTYHYGMISTREVVATQLPLRYTGPNHAATYATTLIGHHKSLREPGCYYFLVGIAGGIWSKRQDVRLGDVVIATTVWDWEAGKITQKGFEHSRHPEDAPKELLWKLPAFLDRRERIGKLITDQIEQMQQKQIERDDRWNYQGQENDILFEADYSHAGAMTCASCDNRKIVQRDERPDTLPYVYDGKIASGTKLLKSAEHRAALQQDDVLAVEMEACGVLDPHKFIVVRGISDYADSHKNDIWHGYAAATAAACARLLVESFLKDDQKAPQSPSIHTDSIRPVTQPLDQRREVSSPTSNRSDSESITSDVRSDDTSSWAPCFECAARDVSVEVGKSAKDPKPHKKSYHKARVIIEVQSHTLLQQKRQRIRIAHTLPNSASATILWLPLTDIGVTASDTSVSARFSNCKQMSKESVNHQESYNPVYDPDNPNVRIQLTCMDESEAVQLSDFLTQKKQHLITEMNDEFHEFSSYMIRNGSARLSEEERRKGIFVWDRSGNYQVFDMAFFTDQLDLKLEKSGDTTELSMYFLSKLAYEPEDIGINIYWPPPEVKANKDGRPSCTKLVKRPPTDKAMILSCTNNLLPDLMNATVGYVTSSEFKGWYDIDFRPVRRISITSKKQYQLMVWSRDEKLYCQMRSGDSDSQSRNQEWTTWTLTARDEDGENSPRLQLSNNSVTLTNLQTRSGDHLSLQLESLFEAQKSEEIESKQDPRKADLKIYFHDDASLRDFQRVVADYVETD